MTEERSIVKIVILYNTANEKRKNKIKVATANLTLVQLPF